MLTPTPTMSNCYTQLRKKLKRPKISSAVRRTLLQSMIAHDRPSAYIYKESIVASSSMLTIMVYREKNSTVEIIQGPKFKVPEFAFTLIDESTPVLNWVWLKAISPTEPYTNFLFIFYALWHLLYFSFFFDYCTLSLLKKNQWKNLHIYQQGH